jgi:hypothetical protein
VKRKIIIEIETLDFDHCSEHCPLCYGMRSNTGCYCSNNVQYLKKDRTGYIRTVECRKNDVNNKTVVIGR